MELELGLKITKTKDDIAFISEYQLAKDKGPVFQSRETNTMFILTAHLKGYKRNKIDIKISKDGSKISISGEKPIQEMVMMGWVMHRKVVDVTGFNKVFKIPDRVNLDKIKAKYDEEEWILSIFMPKLVKGICGLRIEEVKEEEFDKRRSELLEKNETDHVTSSVGETSQKGYKESQVQDMEGSECIMEKKEGGIADKMVDDANKEMNEERIKEEVEESMLGIEDGNDESVRKKVGKEECEVVKKPELEQNVGVCISQKIEDTSQDKEFEVQKMDSGSVEKKKRGESDKMIDDGNGDQTGSIIKKGKEESKLRIKEGKVKGMREKVGKETYEAMKTSEIEQDISQDKEFEDQEMEEKGSVVEKEKMVSDNMVDDSKEDITGEMIQEEIEKSKLGIEEGDGSVKENVGKEGCEAVKSSEIEKNVGAQIIGVTSQGVSEESLIQQSGESKQKEFGESKCESEDRLKENMKESSMEPFEAIKVSELDDQNVVDHIPRKVGGVSQKELKESSIQQMEKTKSTEGKIDGGETEKALVEANKDVEKTIFGDIIKRDIIKPKIETENEVQECVIEKAGKEGFDPMITIREEFFKDLSKTTLEESEGLNVKKKQEIKDVKEEMIKRKGKEIEYFVEKGEGERHKKMHVEENKGFTGETMLEEIEKKKNGIDESGQQHVWENTVKGGFEAPKSKTEELPKQLEELDGSKGFKVAKEEEQKEVIKEAMAETKILMKKMEGEESKKRNEEASRVIEKSTVTETLLKKTEESNIEKKSSDVGESQVLGTAQEKLPKQVMKEVAQDEKDITEYGIVKLKGKGSIKMQVEPKEAFEKDTTGDRIEKEIRKQKLESSDQLSGKENVDSGIFGERERQKFPEMEEAEDAKEEGAKNEQSAKKFNGDKYEKMQVEIDEDFKKEITKETKGKEMEDPKIQTKEKDGHHLHEEMSKERSQASEAAKEYFPMKMLDSQANTREGPKDTKMEKTEVIKGEMSKERSKARKAAKEDFPMEMLDSPADTREGLIDTKTEKTEGIKEENAEIDQLVKKVKGENYEKIKVEAHGGLRNDITKETAQKEKEEPKILINVKDQQCLQEEMSKGRCKASTTAREFPMQIVDSLAKTREGPKGKEMKEAEEAKRKTEETKVAESVTKEKIQGSESERTTQILHEAPEEKHPKALEIGNPERELQSEKCERVVNMGVKEVEQGSAKDKKQKTKFLPPKIQSKETHESKDESMNQDILKPKRTKEVGEQCTYNTASTKEVATIEDQVVKPLSAPRFPSTQQSEVEEKDKKYEGGKTKYEASLESQKKDPMQNLIEMKENQEDKQMETLKPEIPLEKHQKKGGQVIRKGEFHKGQNVGETLQQKTEGPKKKIDVGDQQYVARDVGKVETIREEMSKEYVADAGSIAERMETKRGLKTTLEREEYITTQNVNNEKPKIQDEVIKADNEKVNKAKCTLESMKTTQEKEHPIKSEEAVEKATESLEPISSLPTVTSKGVKEASPKKEIVEPRQKELSPLTAEMKSKQPLELHKPVMQWKFPKTKEHVPFTKLRDKKQHDHGTEEIKAPKIAACERAKPSKLQRPTITQQSTDKENRKSENVVEEHEATKEPPKINVVETEEIDSLQPQVPENQCFEEQNVDEQEEALDQCEFQGPKILIEDRGQQYVQENNDEKGYQTPKAVEEEIVLKKREGSKVAKSEEAKDSSRHKREKGKTTQTAEEKKPTMIEKTPQFEKERVHQIESEEGTSKIGVIEPPTMIEKTPNKEGERKEPHELTCPNRDYETPKISEVQEEKEGGRHVHALEANISKEEGLAQATATHSKAKSSVESKAEIDKPLVNQLPSPSLEMLSKEPRELDEFRTKEDDSNSKEESLVQVREKKEPIHSIEGTTLSEVAADKVSQHSKLSSSSCAQQFEVEGEDKTDSNQNQESQEAKTDSKTDVQESTKCEAGQEVEQIETLQPESLADQQCMNKDKEEKHGRDEIEEEKAYDEVLEEQKECKEEASGGKKDDAKMSKKLFVPLVIAGSALLVSLVVIFVRHRRARKRKSGTKYCSKCVGILWGRDHIPAPQVPIPDNITYILLICV